VDDLRSPAGWLPVHRDQLPAQRSVSSMGSLYLYLFNTAQVGCHKLFASETRSSAIAAGLRNWLHQLKSYQLLHSCTKGRFEETCDSKQASRSIRVTGNGISHISLLLLVCCKNSISVLCCFQDITTFTVYITACDLKKCFRPSHRYGWCPKV